MTRAIVVLGLFLVLPLLEIFVIIQVGMSIGAMPTLLLLVAAAALGVWLIKREGLRTMRALNDAARTGTRPERELADAAIILVGGLLLLVPGFVTDVVGLFCVLPFTRPIARRLLTFVVVRRVARYGGAQYARRRGGAHQIYRDGPPTS